MAREELIALLYRYILAEWIDDEQNGGHRQNNVSTVMIFGCSCAFFRDFEQRHRKPTVRVQPRFGFVFRLPHPVALPSDGTSASKICSRRSIAIPQRVRRRTSPVCDRPSATSSFGC
jgi:hypothetical protein